MTPPSSIFSADSQNRRLIDASDYLGPAVSSTDCTELIPSGLTDRTELEAYEEMYAFTPVKKADSDH